MPLNSWQFVALAAGTIILLPGLQGRWKTAAFLAVNATFVWTYWGAAAVPLAGGFILLGYAAARLARDGRRWTVISSVATLVAIFVWLRGYTFGAETDSPATGIVVVTIAGLSFLFFKMVHVVVDSAAGTIGRLPFLQYLNYCLNFTTVLMGPIQRFQDFSTQWAGTDSLRFEAAIDAVNRVLRGIVKAFVLAPYLAPLVLRPGLPIESLGAGELLLSIYAFYVFLYLDFSGYCDVMIGVGSLIGIRPPENFDFPFLSRNVSAYWLRVHRSLTHWLTDYVFTPAYKFALGRDLLARHAFLALAAALMLTMVVAGVWHGTTANFLVFGIVHGCALVAMRGYESGMTRWLGRARYRRLEARPGVAVVSVLLTYNFTSLAYVFFALDVNDAVRVFSRLAALGSGWT